MTLDSLYFKRILIHSHAHSVNLEDIGKHHLAMADNKEFSDFLCAALRLRLLSLWQSMLAMRPDCMANEHAIAVWYDAIARENNYFFEYCDRRYRTKLMFACLNYDLPSFMISGK